MNNEKKDEQKAIILEEESIIENKNLEVVESKKNTITVNTENGDYEEVKKRIDESVTESLTDSTETLENLAKSKNTKMTLEATKKVISESNNMLSFGDGVSAYYAVEAGNYLTLLKEQVRADLQNWEDYVNKNLNMSLRTVQKYMRIAKIQGVQAHLILGIERLNLLAGVVKDIESNDPISVLISKHSMAFDPTVEKDLDDFKRRIEEIKLKKTAAANNIEMAEETASRMAERGFHLTSDVLAKAKMVKETGGDPEKLFKNLTANVKNNNASSGKNGKKKSPSKPKGFKKLAEELKDFVGKATTTDKETLRDIDLNTLDALLADLETLKAHLAKQ
jgi:hypothetical protein